MYIAKNIDTEKVIKALDDAEKYKREGISKEIYGLNRYMEGYSDAIESAKQMFYCSNYEKKEEIKNADTTN